MSEQLSNSEMNTDKIILLDVPNFYFKLGLISVELVIFVTKEKIWSRIGSRTIHSI